MSSGLLITACQNNGGRDGGGGNNGSPHPQKPAIQGDLCNKAKICMTEQDIDVMSAQFKKSSRKISETNLVRWQAVKLTRAYEDLFGLRLGDENSEFIIELFNKTLERANL
jgi:hypothetical protein